MATKGPIDVERDDRIFERCEDLPPEPAPGNYIVVDVMHFSNTVIELLAAGATYVRVTGERGEEFDFAEEHPRARIGGPTTPEYEPTAGYDFFNSPSFVQSIDIEGRPVCMTSTNGGRTVTRLRTVAAKVDVDLHVYVGSTTNAAAVGRHLRDDPRPTYVVAAGSQGTPAVEDNIGAVLLSRYLDGISPTEAELAIYRERLAVAKGADYVDKHEVRRRDVEEFAMNINCRKVVPRLVDDRLVDVSGNGTE